jgi:hypothetical protein
MTRSPAPAVHVPLPSWNVRARAGAAPRESMRETMCCLRSCR